MSKTKTVTLNYSYLMTESGVAFMNFLSWMARQPVPKRFREGAEILAVAIMKGEHEIEVGRGIRTVVALARLSRQMFPLLQSSDALRSIDSIDIAVASIDGVEPRRADYERLLRLALDYFKNCNQPIQTASRQPDL